VASKLGHQTVENFKQEQQKEEDIIEAPVENISKPKGPKK
jgi:hypothetical protein